LDEAAGTSFVRPMRTVLFVCTGNYYRSRFAEAVFNARAHERALPWRALSRGTDVYGAGRWNEGPLSPFALQGLLERGIDPGEGLGSPVKHREMDLGDADMIIAISEVEHRPHLERDFPAWADQVEYWTVEDLAIT